jgi:FHS family L-fucose permease-like MFS transporter
MDKHFQDFLHLTKSQSAWVQFAHYLGYFLMALPAGWLTRKLGYKKGILSGLLIVSLGCLWFIPATAIATFWAFLLGVCIVSMGLTFLETIANPYVTVLGSPQFAATRINLAQSFNGLGWPLGPLVGGVFFYASEHEGGAQAANETLWVPYAGIGVFVFVLAIVFMLVKLPELSGVDVHEGSSTSSSTSQSTGSQSVNYWLMLLNVLVLSFAMATIVVAFSSIFALEDSVVHAIFAAVVVLPTVFYGIRLRSTVRTLSPQSVWSYPHFSGSTIAQFFYVAAQAGTFAFFMNYVTEELPPLPEILNGSWILGGVDGSIIKEGILKVTEKGGTKLLSIAFGLFVLGRFTGAALLKKQSAHRVLAIYGMMNVGLMLIVVMKLGWISAIALFLSFFFMSIMYPTIFALGIFGLGEKAKVASSGSGRARRGGAILPQATGWVGDHYNMSVGFVIPMICFGVVALYGFLWSKLSGSEGLVGLKSTGGH